jgi:two-component system, chemotaxis family, chemotaxis protein CheY
MRFLIVDDEDFCRELLAETLQPYAACDFACDGEEAIAAFVRALDENAPYDLLCLDIMMPGLNGHEVLEQIRRIETERNICQSRRTKVIMTTALAEAKHSMRAFRAGCENYVVKPFDEADILTAIHDLGLSTTAAALS